MSAMKASENGRACVLVFGDSSPGKMSLLKDLQANGTGSQILHLDTKYYTATAQLVPASNPDQVESSADSWEAVILTFDKGR